MKRILFLLLSVAFFATADAQITITSADMPVVGDTLRYTITTPMDTNINIYDTGANITWNFSTLTALAQAVDTYKTAASVNATYALTISPTAYGYKVADSIPGLSTSGLSVSISDVYTFFNIKSGPSRFIAEAFAAKVSSFPTAAAYTAPDVWYYFPLAYHNSDSTNYSLTVSVPSIGSLKQKGYRKNRVDSWGTIVTPYYTTPTNCIRVRSEVHEIDSISVPLLGLNMGVPRNFIEYKWLANGEHYPALWVTANIVAGTPRVTSVTYRDKARRSVSITNVQPSIEQIKLYPNPATNGIVNLDIPAGWSNFFVEIFDMQGKVVATFENTRQLNIQALAQGKYLVRAVYGSKVGYAPLVK